MPRPTEAVITDVTSSGVPFQWLLDGYEARGAPDANAEVVHAMVAWDASTTFLRDIVGYTTFDSTLPNLTRIRPHKCPTRTGLFADEYRMVDFGMYESRSDVGVGGLPAQDWIIYAVTFVRPHWKCVADEILKSDFANKEQFRYCRRSRRYIPRERRTSGFAYQYQKADGTFADVPDEARFQPDFQIEYTVTWKQVPVAAIPEDAIAELLMTVNDDAFDIGFGFTFDPGTLLFKGPQQDIEEYAAADGSIVEDLKYVWAFQPGGWNYFLRPDLVGDPPRRDYGIIQRKNVKKDPLYPPGSHQKLFIPVA